MTALSIAARLDRAFFATLEELGFQGDMVIEREAGNQRIADIRTAREAVERAAH